MKDICVICNPSAGSVGDAGDTATWLRDAAPVTVRVTASNRSARDLAQEAAEQGFNTIVAAGGDGTLNEVINGIVDHIDDVRVGLIPLGTGNDFARAADLPDDPEDCIEVIEKGTTRPVDLVRVTSDKVRYLINVSAGGFSGTVGEKLTPEIKKSWGPLAYLRGAAQALPELRAYRTELVLDDVERIDANLYNVIIANGRYVAGGTPVAPEALLDDGLVDIVLVPERPAAEIALMAAQMLLGKHIGSDAVVFRRAAKVSVRSTPGMWFNVDGELATNEPATFEVMHRALQFIMPHA